MKNLSFTPKIGETYYYLTLSEKHKIISIHPLPIVFNGNENTLTDYNLFRSREEALKVANEIKAILTRKVNI